jgi:formate dehydrogenase major subunit
VIIISTEKTDLAGHQNAILLQLKPGTDAALIAGLLSATLAEGVAPAAKGLDGLEKDLVGAEAAAAASGVTLEQIAAAAKAYAAAKHPVVIIGTGISMSEEASAQALNLALAKSAGVLPLLLEANAIGVMQAGCLPDLGPGFAKAAKAGKGYGDMLSGMKALLVAGPVPDAAIKAETLIVVASHMTPLAEKADVVLPLAALYERSGSIVNVYGRQKTIAAAQEAEGTAKDGADIAAEISLELSKTKGFTMKDVAAAVKKMKHGTLAAASFRPVSAKAGKAAPASTSALLAALNQGMLANSAVAKVLVVRENQPASR